MLLCAAAADVLLLSAELCVSLTLLPTAAAASHRSSLSLSTTHFHCMPHNTAPTTTPLAPQAARLEHATGFPVTYLPLRVMPLVCVCVTG